jgi:Tfp pilus assembly protein PilW
MSRTPIKKNKNGGFTLIELLLYVGTFFLVLVSIAALFVVLISSRIKNQTVSEVEDQGGEAMHMITQAIRSADGINYPLSATASSSVSLVMASSTLNPTIFSISNGAIVSSEGGGSAIPLTNQKVTASGLTIQNLSGTSTPGNLLVSFTLTRNNPQSKNEYSFTDIFTSAASLRP